MSGVIEAQLTEREAIALLEHARLEGGNRSIKRAFGARLLRWTASHALRALVDSTLATSGCRLDDPYGGFEGNINGQGHIGCCWHNRLLGLLLIYRGLYGRPLARDRCVAVISESDDGELVARLFRDLGGSCIRGSSSKRAQDAMRNIVRELNRGAAVYVTPDGPRGPKHELQDGIILAARLSGKPIVPTSASFGRLLRFERSWDQFEMPLPFGRFTCHVGKPLFVPRNLDADGMEQVKAALYARMAEVTARADAQPTRVYAVGQPRGK